MLTTLFKNKRAKSAGSAQRAPLAGNEPAGAVKAPERHALRGTRYVTDGVELYRLLGAVARGACEMVGLENCRSLEIILVPIADLRLGRLRSVIAPQREAFAALAI
jgi:hypothetical protein